MTRTGQSGTETTDGDVMVEIKNVCLRFQLSYEKVWTLREFTTDTMKSLRGKDPKKQFEALSDVNFTARRGDVIGIIGPNGCGKTTLLRVVSGIFPPDEGEVSTHGRISSLLSLSAGVNQNLAGYENIRMNALLFGMSRQEIDEKIDQICAFADIGEFINVPMKYYSNGMVSRLNFAIVLALDPEIILIDEIFSVGDLAFQEKSRGAIDAMLERAKCQLIVTHSLALVEQRCNRAIMLSGGRIIMDGPPDEVVAFYRDWSARQ